MSDNDTSYDPAQADEYVNHLARLGRNREAIASEDIYNEAGALLVQRGTPIRSRTAASLFRHRLQQALDHVVMLSDCKSSEELLADIRALLARYPDLQQIHDAHAFDDKLQQLFLFKALPHPLLQKLTVLEENLPEVFERTLFCAWLAPLIALRMKLPPSSIYNVFIASLGHDLGLLHLPTETVLKRQDINTQEWRAIQSHVVLGRMILEHLNSFDEEVLLAVQNHHEHCDGTGYPMAKREAQLDRLSQIIALCDLLHGMRTRQFEPAGKNLADAMPFLRLNSRTFSRSTQMAVVAILRRSGLQPGSIAVKDPQRLVQQLLQNGQGLQQLLALLQTLYELVQQMPNNRYAQALETLFEHAYTSMRSSGLGSEQLAQWLQALTPEEAIEIAPELLEMKGLCDEAHWVFKRAQRLIPQLTVKAGTHTPALKALYQEMDQVLANWAAS